MTWKIHRFFLVRGHAIKTFFILSLPRTRTAWIANFLTYDTSFCFHEALIDVNPVDLPKLFKSTEKPIVGNSDCGNILFLDEIIETFMDAKLVIVERPIDEVISSLDTLGEKFSERESVYQALDIIEYAKYTYDHLLLDFHKLDNTACRALWDHCIGTPFNEQRWKMLDGLNTEIIPEKKLQQLSSLLH